MLSIYTLENERRYFLTQAQWILIHTWVKYSDTGNSKSSGFCYMAPCKVNARNKRFTVKHAQEKQPQLKKTWVCKILRSFTTNKAASSFSPQTHLGKRNKFCCQNVGSNVRFTNEAVTLIHE